MLKHSIRPQQRSQRRSKKGSVMGDSSIPVDDHDLIKFKSALSLVDYLQLQKATYPTVNTLLPTQEKAIASVVESGRRLLQSPVYQIRRPGAPLSDETRQAMRDLVRQLDQLLVEDDKIEDVKENHAELALEDVIDALWTSYDPEAKIERTDKRKPATQNPTDVDMLKSASTSKPQQEASQEEAELGNGEAINADETTTTTSKSPHEALHADGTATPTSMPPHEGGKEESELGIGEAETKHEGSANVEEIQELEALSAISRGNSQAGRKERRQRVKGQELHAEVSVPRESSP